MKSKDAKPKPKEEVWFYVGRRMNQKGKIVNGYLDEGGVERWFSKTPARIIGGRYKCQVSRTENSVTIHGASALGFRES